jgi:hypothetical protein
MIINNSHIVLLEYLQAGGVVKEVLLTCRKLNSDNKADVSFGSNEHIEHLEKALKIYNKDLTDIMAVIGDNCSTNKSLAKKLQVPLIGCRSHILNLAINDYFKNYKEELDKVRILMDKLCTLKNSAILEHFTLLKPVQRNTTRWSSTYEMVKRYFRLEPYLKLMPTVTAYLPDNFQYQTLMVLLHHMRNFHSITMELQIANMDIRESRELFDQLIDEYPEMDFYLKADAKIIHNPIFDRAVIKVVSNMEDNLSDYERKSIELFKIPKDHNSNTAEDNSIDKSDKAHTYETTRDRYRAKRQKREQEEQRFKESEYVDLRFLLSTSNVVERLFSLAKLTLTDHRMRMAALTFESLLLLQKNKDYWNISDVSKAIMAGDDDNRHDYDDDDDY